MKIVSDKRLLELKQAETELRLRDLEEKNEVKSSGDSSYIGYVFGFAIVFIIWSYLKKNTTNYAEQR